MGLAVHVGLAVARAPAMAPPNKAFLGRAPLAVWLLALLAWAPGAQALDGDNDALRGAALYANAMLVGARRGCWGCRRGRAAGAGQVARSRGGAVAPARPGGRSGSCDRTRAGS